MTVTLRMKMGEANTMMLAVEDGAAGTVALYGVHFPQWNACIPSTWAPPREPESWVEIKIDDGYVSLRDAGEASIIPVLNPKSIAELLGNAVPPTEE